MEKGNELKILLCEDDHDDCLFFTDALEELALNASLTIVHNGEQLTQHLQTFTDNMPDVLFLDLNMPRKDGYECLAEIKNHPTLKELPVVIYSTSYDEAIANRLYKGGAAYYICKPADFDKLKAAVNNALMLVTKK